MTPNALSPGGSGIFSESIPLEIICHGLTGDDVITELVREKSAPLEKFHDHIHRCVVTIERPNHPEPDKNIHGVRLDLTVSSDVVLTVIEDRENHEAHEPLCKILADAFQTAEHRLQEIIAHHEGNSGVKNTAFMAVVSHEPHLASAYSARSSAH